MFGWKLMRRSTIGRLIAERNDALDEADDESERAEELEAAVEQARAAIDQATADADRAIAELAKVRRHKVFLLAQATGEADFGEKICAAIEAAERQAADAVGVAFERGRRIEALEGELAEARRKAEGFERAGFDAVETINDESAKARAAEAQAADLAGRLEEARRARDGAKATLADALVERDRARAALAEAHARIRRLEADAEADAACLAELRERAGIHKAAADEQWRARGEAEAAGRASTARLISAIRYSERVRDLNRHLTEDEQG